MKEPQPLDIQNLAADPALTSDAFRLLAYVSSLGSGEHEIPSHRLRMLLRCRDDRPIREAREIASDYGLMWRRGGRGHSNSYWFESAPAQNQTLKSATVQDQKPDESAPAQNQNVRVGPRAVSNGSAGGTIGGEAVEEVAVAGEEENAGAPEATDVPEYELSERAARVLSERGDDLNGCRGALKDYLRARVPTDRQYGYAQTVATWIDGGDWSVFKLPDGSRAPPEKIPKLLGAALNELLAGDESMMKRPVGDPGNLKTKLSILCKQRGDHARHDSDTRSTSGGKKSSAGPEHNPIRGDPSRRRRGNR